MKKWYLSLSCLSLLIPSLYAQQSSDAYLINLIKEKSGCTQIDIHVQSSHTDKQTGITHAYVSQYYNGVEIMDAASSIHYNSLGNVIRFNNRLFCNAQEMIVTVQPLLGAWQALEKAASETGVLLPENAARNKQAVADADGRVQFDKANHLSAKPVFTLHEAKLKLAWDCEVYDHETHDWWHIRIDAVTGALLNKNNWTTHCNQHESHARVATEVKSIVHATQQHSIHKKTSTGATYNVFPFPVESPNHGNRQLMTELIDPSYSPYGWHDTDGVAGADFTTTRGNNVLAKEDTLANNQIGYAPDAGNALVFDYGFDPNRRARLNLDAAITNLFYWNNLIHDIFYVYGFDEASGNFQSNNFGRGGSQLDPVHADAQDGSGLNNANFQTPVDGNLPRMQMYLWNPQGTNTSRNLLVGNGLYDAIYANFGPKPFDTITAPVVLVNDSSTNPTLGCDTIQNDLTGKIALVYRGTCGYSTKVLNAQRAGALAVLVVNTSNQAFAMTGNGAGITIPALMLRKSLGDSIKNRLDAGDTTMVLRIFQAALAVTQFDSDFDNGVIVHEYGHGISIRLTGGRLNSSCLTGNEQAGEGWSDFFALCLTAKASDSTLDGRGIGTYVFNEPITGDGIRTYKYTRDMTVNPSTYNTIRSLSIPHGVGSVWCTMLYDIYWDMVDKYGFNEDIFDAANGGNNMTLQLVVDALKLQPCNPGFVDMRDALIEADSLRYGGANKELLWKAFARRGLGASASQGSVTSNTDGTEAFDLPTIATGLMNDKAWNQVRVWPNPANESIQIALPDAVGATQCTLTDLTGRVVLTKDIHNSENRIVTDNLQNGVYLIQLVNNGRTYQTKIVVTH